MSAQPHNKNPKNRLKPYEVNTPQRLVHRDKDTSHSGSLTGRPPNGNNSKISTREDRLNVPLDSQDILPYVEGNPMVIDTSDEPPYTRPPYLMTLSIDRKVPVLGGVANEGVRLADAQPIIDREGMWADSSQPPKSIWPQKAKEDALMSDVERAARNISPLRAANTAEAWSGEESSSLESRRQETTDPSRVFQGAHHFMVKDSIFIANATNPESGADAMKYLSQRAIVDAQLDSAARFPPPSCHPETRQDLRGRITSWLADVNRNSNLFWLYGPAGAGKSAVAQTIAEYYKEQGLLGAAFFFSRPNNYDDPNRVIPSLAHQLAVTFPTYKQLFSCIFKQDSSILSKALRLQFQKLIEEPLASLVMKGPSAHPILLVLDGLDECRGDEPQRVLIELVATFAALSNTSRLPIVWIIASRPEWQIVSTFSKFQCQQEELRIDTTQAAEDVARILHDSFSRIREKYNDAFAEGEVWPSPSQFLAVKSASGGLPVFSSTLLKFVDDEEIGNPVAQLDACLGFLKGNVLPKSGNPLDPLHLLYWGILRTIHPSVVPTTVSILLFTLLERSLPAQTVANFLRLDQATFYGSLRRLHSVLEVPKPGEAGFRSIGFLHASFEDFLKHTIRSGGDPESGLTMSNFNAVIERCCNQWSDIRKTIDTSGQYRKALSGVMSWPGDDTPTFQKICECVPQLLMKIWLKKADEDVAKLDMDLRNFDFAAHQNTGFFFYPAATPVLAQQHRGMPFVSTLMCGLNAWQIGKGNSPCDLLRLEPNQPTDYQLLEQYAHLVSYPGMAKADFTQVQRNPAQWCYLCFSAKGGHPIAVIREALLSPNLTYFLLGQDTRTALVITYQPRLVAQQFISEAIRQTSIARDATSVTNSGIWPPEDLALILSSLPDAGLRRRARRQPSMAHTVASFIADFNIFRDVIVHLNIVSPLPPIHDLQVQVAECVFQHRHPAADQILAFLLCMNHYSITCGTTFILIQHISNFLGLDNDISQKAIRSIYPLISFYALRFPMSGVLDLSVRWASQHIFSMPPELDESSRSSSKECNYSIIATPYMWLDVSIRFIQWFHYFLDGGPTLELLLPGFPNDLDQATSTSVNTGFAKLVPNRWQDFRRQVFTPGYWVAFHQVNKETAPRLLNELRNINFYAVQRGCGYTELELDAPEWVACFCSFVNKISLYQTELDLETIIIGMESCEDDAESLPNASFPIDISTIHRVYFRDIQWASPYSPQRRCLTSAHQTFFLGVGENACLVILELKSTTGSGAERLAY